MKKAIPLVAQIDDTEKQQWIEAINRESKHCTVLAIESATEYQKASAEVAIVANPAAADLNRLPKLKWVQSLWAGVENVLASDIQPDLSIVRLTDPQLADSMAEATLAWCLSLRRNMHRYRQFQQQKQWLPQKLDPPATTRIGVFGLGKLGTESADRLKQNQFTVRGWSRTEKQLDNIECYYGENGFNEILGLIDIAVILLPLTEQTHKLFNESTLRKLPQGASIINFGRGPIIDEQDLLTCLNDNHLEHAVLDVFNTEPLPQTHAFWTNPSVTVLPHISGPTTVSTASRIAATHIDAYVETGEIPETVNRRRGY